jgi:hypothetical protein
MAIHFMTEKAARAIYEYAGTDGLKPWESLPPTVQISYVEEAEAAIKEISDYIKYLASQVDVQSDEQYIIKGTMLAVADSIDPKTEPI